MRSQQLRPDRGAVLVETALIATFLAILAMGIFEFGMAWRQSTQVERALLLATRATANVATGPTLIGASGDLKVEHGADVEAMLNLRSSLAGINNLSVERVIIYRSSTADGDIPSACLVGPQQGVCNHFDASHIANPSWLPCSSTAPDRHWCPRDRTRDRPNHVYIGLQIDARYTGVTGLLPGGGIDITRRAVYAIEPCAIGIIGCEDD